MSEFSDSVHFYTIQINELKEKLISIGVSAFILNENQAPFSVLLGWEDKTKLHNLNFGGYLDFSYSNDHGLSCKFYLNGELIGRANRFWGEDFGFTEPPESPNAEVIDADLQKNVTENNILSQADAETFLSLFEKYDPDDWKVREEFINEVGSVLKLKQYRHLSCEDLKHNLNMLLEINPNGRIKI